MENKKVKLSIIILSFNTKDLLKQCLDSVVEGCRGIDEYEVIIVDNASVDGSVEEMDKFKSRIKNLKLIKNKENLGYPKANNQGIKEASGDYIMLLNSDTIVKDRAIFEMVQFLDSHREYEVIGPRLLNSDGSLQSNCGRFPKLPVAFVMLFKEHFGGSNFVRWSPGKSQTVDWLMGAAFMARREVFDKVGGLDENIFMYMEEVEWFYRTQKLNFKTYFLKEVEIIHLGMGSSKTGKTDPILNIYRGLLYFYKKHLSLSEVFILKLMLKIKAVFALVLGYIKSDEYLKTTYGQAVKIN